MFIFGGIQWFSMVLNVELKWGKPLNHTPPPSPISRDAICQILCLYIYVWPHSDNIFEFTSFHTRKGGFLPPDAKRPNEFGVVITNLRWPSAITRKY